MDKLEYKGYVGSIEYSKADNCLYGQVLGLSSNTCITYEGNTAEELFEDFKGGIDHYLEHCKENNFKPEKPYDGIINIKVPPKIHSRIAVYAERQRTTISSFVRRAIERELETA